MHNFRANGGKNVEEKGLRDGGAKAQRHEGTEARRHRGTKARRHEGTEARRGVPTLRGSPERARGYSPGRDNVLHLRHDLLTEPFFNASPDRGGLISSPGRKSERSADLALAGPG